MALEVKQKCADRPPVPAPTAAIFQLCKLCLSYLFQLSVMVVAAEVQLPRNLFSTDATSGRHPDRSLPLHATLFIAPSKA